MPVHLSGMAHAQHSVRVIAARDGIPTYLVELPPDALPPVRARDVAAAWDAAREAASGAQWGLPRRFRFRQPDGTVTDLTLADQDACCWAAAVDATTGMQTAYGLSLCLRLLALVDLLARAPWTGALCRIGRAGATLDPALLQTAAAAPLTGGASFDETEFQARLGRHISTASPGRLPSGALA